MKATDKQTQHILLKAETNSDWDFCNFAIVHITDDWKEEQQKRLDALRPFADDYNFQSLNYRDTAVDFYRLDDNGQPDIYKLLAGKNWAFVEFNKGELETLHVPENHLECHSLVLYGNGSAMYKAYGECRSEEFWTEEFDLNTLCLPIGEEDELEKLCKERFKHLTNAQLVARVNGLPAFGWDDEGVELQRRHRVSNGKFDYGFKYNTMVILKDEKQ